MLVDPAKLTSYWLTFKDENIKTIDQTIEAGVQQMKKQADTFKCFIQKAISQSLNKIKIMFFKIATSL